LAAKVLSVFAVAAWLAWPVWSRPYKFRAQAQAGQPIVRAIEDFHRQTGRYPSTMAELVPKYLASLPELADRANYNYTGWEYTPSTSGTTASYQLRYYLGRGGVEYHPPNWIGDDEGTRKVILTNDRQ
jgi:hypothetical protein